MATAIVNPSTGQLIKSFESLTGAEIEAKLQRAADTFRSYRKTPFGDQARWMLNAAAILQRGKKAYAQVMTTDMGKTFRSAVDEVAKCAWVCRYYAENAEHFLADEVVETGAKRSYIRYQPLGPVLAVMPWNFPFWQVLRFVAPALLAGNVGLLKHASIAPQSALLIEELFLRAGFPEGVFQTLLIGSREVHRIVGDSRVMAATLTGSEQAGIEVGIGAAKRIKKVVLELGGGDPFIVMPSVNLETATSIAVKARIFNNGQSCIAAKRFIVAESIAEELEQRFAKKMAALKVGDPFDESTELGPLATREGVNDLDRDVRKTVEAGAKILARGKAVGPPGKPLRTYCLDQHSKRFAGLSARTVWSGGQCLPRKRHRRSNPNCQR
jgi:succinate-semialdehyde dehydrogenase/glutarate-semialdehyde dehydrogenase